MVVTKLTMVVIFLTMMFCLVDMMVARWGGEGGEGGEGVNPICGLYPNIYVFTSILYL